MYIYFFINGGLINIGSCRGPPEMPQRTTRGRGRPDENPWFNSR